MANYKPVENFSNLYNRVYGMFNNTYTPQSASTLKDALSRSMRPAYDKQIAAREDAAKANRAAIDTDAASRGMGSSSWVTDVKNRQNNAAASDIANINSDYQANLYNALLNRLGQQDELAMSAAQSAQSNALGLTNQLYGDVFKNTGGGGGGRGGSSDGGGGGGGVYQDALNKLKKQGYTTRSAVDYLLKGTNLQKVQKSQPKKKVTYGGVGINYLAAR